jgi:hypothetical protein
MNYERYRQLVTLRSATVGLLLMLPMTLAQANKTRIDSSSICLASAMIQVCLYSATASTQFLRESTYTLPG